MLPSDECVARVVVIAVVTRVAALGRRIIRMPRPLATQVLLLQIAIVVASIVAAGVLSFWLAREQLVGQYQERALALARVVATTPEIVDAYADADPSRRIQPIAEAIRRSSGASFVVVTDKGGIRYSHPNPERIGERVSTDPSSALGGQEFVGVERGTLGVSVRAKVPVVDRGGAVIGIVSLGFLEEELASDLAATVPFIAGSVLLALALGLTGSVAVARRLRRQTFDLGPREIAGLLEQREAMLHGVREGVLATDGAGRITLVNDEARRLLGLDASADGRAIAEVIPAGRVRDALTQEGAPDQVVLAGDRVLVTNRMPVVVRGAQAGAVVTLRDRTELEGVLRELDSVKGLAHALRAQTHEFSNKLHTVAGLVELGRYREAVRFITETALVHQELVDLIQARIGEPVVAALLLAKAAVASERGVQFRIADDAHLTADAGDARDLVTVIGNLVDNAIEAVAPSRGWVEVSVRGGLPGVDVRVRDSGPGVDPAMVDEIFREGATSKQGHFGIGLALVGQVTRRRGGWVRVTKDGGAMFTAFLGPPGAQTEARSDQVEHPGPKREVPPSEGRNEVRA